MIEQDLLGKQVKTVFLGIGSNLGERKKNIEKAKFELTQNRINVAMSSNFYESLSWPNPYEPKYLNIVLKIFTDLSPQKLLNICKKIEFQLGRRKSFKNAPRECDIDIIDYNNQQIEQNLTIPHPRMHIRNFVLLPLFELDKKWKHPVSKDHIKTLILSLSNRDIRSIKQI